LILEEERGKKKPQIRLWEKEKNPPPNRGIGRKTGFLRKVGRKMGAGGIKKGEENTKCSMESKRTLLLTGGRGKRRVILIQPFNEQQGVLPVWTAGGGDLGV